MQRRSPPRLFLLASSLTVALSGLARAAAPLDARHSPFADGNASPPFSAGLPSRIATLIADRRSRIVVVRNNTNMPVEHARVTPIALDKQGRVIGKVVNALVRPFRIEPGEVGLAAVQDYSCGVLFKAGRYQRCRIKWPRGTHFRYVTKGDPPGPPETNGWDFTIASTARSDADISMVILPKSRLALRGAPPYFARAICFSSAGAPLFALDSLVELPDTRKVETVTLHDDRDRPCPVYLGTVTGGGAG